jgi:thiol-disulfide isomerase/thioredoxin
MTLLLHTLLTGCRTHIRRLCTILLFLTQGGIWAFLGVAATSDEPRNAVRLQLHSGNALSGLLMATSGSFLRLHSPDFTDPIEIPLKEVRTLAFPLHLRKNVREPAANTTAVIEEPFLFLTTSDAIRANIRSFTDEEFLLQNARHGEFALLRSQVRRIRHLGKQATLRTGSLHLTDLRSLRQRRPIREWTEIEGQGLITTTFGAEMFRDFDFPESAEVRILLESTKNLQFCLAIASVKSGRLAKDALKVETWNDELVAQCEAQGGINFHSLGTMSDTRQLELHLRWDQWSREFSVHAENGELLGKLESIESAKRTGIYLQNRGSDLKVLELSVSHVGKGSREPLPPGAMRFEFADGSQVAGSLEKLDLVSRSLEISTVAGETETVLLDNLYSATVDGERRKDDVSMGAHLVAFTDTTRLHGDLVAADGAFLSLQTPLSRSPLKFPLDDIAEVESTHGAPGPSKAPYRLTLHDHTYMGALARRDEDGRIGWKIDGANNVTTPRSGTDAFAERSDYDLPPPQITALTDSSASGSDASKLSDIVYLKTGESIPCEVQSMTSKSLQLYSTESDRREISTRLIRGVEFHRVPFRAFPPFTEWESQEQATRLERQENRLSFFSAANRIRQDGVTPSASISSSKVTRGDQWEFDLEFEQPSYLQVEIRRSDESNAPQTMECVYLAFSYNGTMIQSYMHYQGPGAMRNIRQATSIIRNQKRTKVQVDFTGNGVTMTMGKEQPLEVRTNRFSGDNFLVRLHFYNMQNAEAKADDGLDLAKEKRMCSFSNLRIFSRPLHSRLNLTAEESDILLTIPRSHKPRAYENLLVARNRDILRGNLVSVDDKIASFAVRGQNLEIPRERLIGVLWLEPPVFDPNEKPDRQEADTIAIRGDPDEHAESPGSPPPNEDSDPAANPPAKDLVDLVLESGIRLQVASARLTADGIEGLNAWTGKVRLPLTTLRQVRFEPATNPLDYAGLPILQQKFAPEPRFSADEGTEEGAPLIGTRSPLVGSALGTLQCPTIGGNEFRSDDHAGKVLVIDFWATWCAPCVREIPQTLQTIAQFPADRVYFLALNQGENSEAVSTFLKSHAWDITVGLDPESQWSKKLKITAIPQTMIVGPDGNVARVYTGSHRDLQREIAATITALLNE